MEKYEKAKLINEKIKETPLYLSLKKAEEEMINDGNTFKLLMDYQNKQREYNEALKYEKYGSNPQKIQQELAALKYKVDTNELVKKYNSLYKEVSSFLKDLTNVILKGVIE